MPELPQLAARRAERHLLIAIARTLVGEDDASPSAYLQCFFTGRLGTDLKAGPLKFSGAGLKGFGTHEKPGTSGTSA